MQQQAARLRACFCKAVFLVSEKIDFNLYLITDRKLFKAGCSMYVAIETALEAGIKAVQLREKDLPVREILDMAYWMRELTDEFNAKLFINDRVDVAMAVNADGVHLTQNSMPAYAVRKISGDKFIIGQSTHNIEEALKAQEEGVDFITLGPVFKTPSKMQYGEPIGIEAIKNAKKSVSIPLFAIGGIKPENVQKVRSAGADGIALISAILAAEDKRQISEEILRLLK